MNEIDNIELRSEEVQEILGTPPSWMVRWGTTIAFCTVLILLWTGYFIRYPDKVTERVRVTSREPAKKLIAENTTYISRILVENDDTVVTGQTLMVFKSKGNWEDVLVLEDYILSVKQKSDSALLAFNPPNDLLLGELQEDLYEFFQRQDALDQTSSGKYEKLSIRQLRKQISSLQSKIFRRKRDKTSAENELKEINQRFQREQNLYYKKEIPFSQLRQTKEERLAVERRIQSAASEIKNSEFKIESIQDKINGVKRGSRESASTASVELRESFTKLENRLEDWKKQHMISSPIDGMVVIPNDQIGEQQFVSRETELMLILPLQKTETVGKISMNLSGSGKVQTGQEVVIKFDSYPFHEFGAVIGEVSRKGKVPNAGTIPIEVSFPNGLRTTTGKILDLNQEMVGTAEIITVDKRFIERIFENFRKFLS